MVNRKRNFTLHFYLMAALTTLALGSVNYLGMEFRTRLDLTSDKRFTLSEGTQRLFEKLTEPINVTYYVDEEPPAKRINLERDVRDKLGELAVSSGGKLQYRIERIGNEEASTKREELEKKGITDTVDVLTSGTDERSEMRGVQGYFSSIEVSYGTAKPKVINGIVNLVDKADEAREHRVDTLEFDIAFAVLSLRNDTQRPSFERLLKTRDKPVRLALYISDPMGDQYKPLAENLEKALDEISRQVPAKVNYQRIALGEDAQALQKYPFGDGAIRVQPFDVKRELVMDSDGNPTDVKVTPYIAAVIIQTDPEADQFQAIWSFKDQQSVADMRKVIEDQIWEGTRSRSRVGFVLPPHDPRYGQQPPNGPPLNGYTPLMQYMHDALDYETVYVDIKKEKRIPRDLACLLVMEPNILSERELYEIERYLNEGGNVVLLVQGWEADLGLMPDSMTNGQAAINKVDIDPTFEEWAKHLGVEFGQDLLLRSNAILQPWQISFDRNTGRQRASLYPSTIKFAPVVEPEDLNQSSVFTRGVAGMPLPFLIEEKVNADRVRELELEQTELIRMKDDVFKFIPEDPTQPKVPLKLNLKSPAEVQVEPKTTPGKDIRAQKLDHDPLIATLLRGQFPSFWVDEGRKVPGWDGQQTTETAMPVLNPQKGNLLVMSSAASLNVNYFTGYSQVEQQKVVIPRGINFYRNTVEAFIYGDDLVSLRARTGVAPRIVGPVEDSTRAMWFMFCIAGAPLLLLMFAGLRSFIRTRERDDYEISLGIRESK
ncbi:MAG: Gldg family protein [Planctomycetes bacterium]|nr:Gldg family protein [Planctomycetota bacterium]